jgi:hypothetical protein
MMSIIKKYLLILLSVLIFDFSDSWSTPIPREDEETRASAKGEEKRMSAQMLMPSAFSKQEIQPAEALASYKFLTQANITVDGDKFNFPKCAEIINKFSLLSAYFKMDAQDPFNFFESVKAAQLNKEQFTPDEQYQFCYNVALAHWHFLVKTKGQPKSSHEDIWLTFVFKNYAQFTLQYLHGKPKEKLPQNALSEYRTIIIDDSLFKPLERAKRLKILAEACESDDDPDVRGLAYICFSDVIYVMDDADAFEIQSQQDALERRKLFLQCDQKIKNVWSRLPKNVRQSGSVALYHDMMMAKTQVDENKSKNTGTKAVLKAEKDQGDIELRTAQTQESNGRLEDAAQHAAWALFKYHKASSNQRPEWRLDTFKKCRECIEFFERTKRQIMRDQVLQEADEIEQLALLYNISGDLPAQEHMRATIIVLTELGEHEKALLRCQAFCRLLERKNQLTDDFRMLRIKLKALNGDLTELKAFIDEKKSKNSKQKQRKKERLAAGAIAARQMAEEAAKAEAEEAEAAKAKAVEAAAAASSSKPAAEKSQKEIPYAFEVATNQDYITRKKVVKVKAQEPIANPVAGSAMQKKAAAVKPPKMKPLEPDTYHLCNLILSNSKEVKAITREEIFQLFASLKCTIDMVRGKGSHAVIKYVRDKAGTVVGCLPEFEDEEIEDTEEDNNSSERNITMTVPNFVGPMHHYLRIALRNMLIEMGYTLESIQCSDNNPSKTKSVDNNYDQKTMDKKKS